MISKNIKQWSILDCTPAEAYEAWLDSKKHSRMLGGESDEAKIDPKVGGKFSVWGNTVTGETLELSPEKYRIVQTWRYEYEDWPEDMPSKIIIEFVPYKEGKCKLHFWQGGVPATHVDEITEGWKDYYWKPMQKYFSK